MPNLPHNIYTAEQIRHIEHIAAEEHNLSSAKLMTRAGAATLTLLKQRWPEAKHLLILCGLGNNGGDGFELARQAAANGYQITLLQIGGDTVLAKTAAAAKDALLLTDVKIQRFQKELPSADLIIDALFGAGINRAIDGEANSVIKILNKTKTSPVLSLDIPSGIHADTGNILGIAVNATVTLSFIGLNTGLFTGHGPNFSGEVVFDSLDTPSTIYKRFTPAVHKVTLKEDAEQLAPRERMGHKGLYGHLLVIGGDLGMSGATRLAAEAGARVGAGLTSIATRNAHSAFLNQTRPELMCHGIDNPENLDPLLNIANALIIGPGLGQSDWAKILFQKAIDIGLPLVVDADALNLLSQNTQHNSHRILTPHPGEAARLLNCSSADIQADRLNAVQEIQGIYGGIVVLKGSGTLIHNGEKPIHLSTAGNPGMSTGGMGDVLSGVIGGLVAQGFQPMNAASIGVTLHGMAGDKAAMQDGERGMLAMDLMPHLRHLANLIY
jgi:NAD(P)H-hydrate epimerase